MTTDSRTARLRALLVEARHLARELHAEADVLASYELTTIANYCTRAITRIGHIEKGWRK